MASLGQEEPAPLGQEEAAPSGQGESGPQGHALGPILAVNVGSSSLKLSIVDRGQRIPLQASSVEQACQEVAGTVAAVAHRIVHGGASIRSATVVDDAVAAELQRLATLAPLHQPPALQALAIARELLPEVPHIACPDTAFHRTMPAAASTYAVPLHWRDNWEVRRYGFHGLSHRWSSRRATELVPSARRIVVAHLGAGASLCAVLDGRSIDTTMGFTPLEGLVMATRSGSVDPGLLPWLTTAHGLTADQIYDTLVHQSGLLGLSGKADMRDVLNDAGAEAQLALDVFLHRLRASTAAMVAALGGLDVLVFTAGIGENSPDVRARSVADLAWLGLALDNEANDAARGVDADITDRAAGPQAPRVLVIHAQEDVEMAAEVIELLLADRSG
jgi:acetate kinase